MKIEPIRRRGRPRLDRPRSDFSREFGMRLRGRTLSEVAKLLGVHYDTAAQWNSGRRTPATAKLILAKLDEVCAKEP